MPPAPALQPLSPQLLADLSGDEPDAMAAVLQGLGHHNWQVRRAAVSAVARWYRNHAVDTTTQARLNRALVDGLNAQENAGLRNACAQAIGALGDTAVPALQHMLTDSDVDQRRFIIEALGSSGAPRVRALLVSMLTDEIAKLEQNTSDSNIRTALMEALARYASADMRELLLHVVQAPQSTLQDKAQALHTLCAWQAQLPLTALLALLPMPGLSRAVYPLLALCHDAQAIDVLMHASLRASGAARRIAVVALSGLWKALGSAGDAPMRTALLAYPDAAKLWAQELYQDPAVIDAAVRLLGLCNCAVWVGPIVQACSDSGQAQAAIDCMVRQGTGVLPAILQAMAERDTQCQLLCVDLVEALGDAAAAYALVDMLPRSHGHLTNALIRALGGLGGPDVLPTLMDMVRQHDQGELSRQVVWALTRMAQRHKTLVAQAMRQALAHGDVQPSWVRVLGAMGQTEDVPRLVAALGHQDAEVRVGVLEAATHMGARLPEQAVLASLSDANPEVRLAAAKLLGAYGSDAAFEALMAAMQDVDPWVVAEAARALGQTKKSGGVDALQKAAAHANGPIAVAALESLAKLAPSDLNKTVQLALKHVDAEVVREALLLASQLERSFAQATLCDALGHKAWDVRAAAAELLLRRRWLPTLEVVERALEHEGEPLVRERLEQLHSRLGALS